jgi:hypothetical protein
LAGRKVRLFARMLAGCLYVAKVVTHNWRLPDDSNADAAVFSPLSARLFLLSNSFFKDRTLAGRRVRWIVRRA